MSVATKLHILLITTILGVGLYMFLLYKEIKVFEREVADLRVKVHSISAQLPHSKIVEVVATAPTAQPDVIPAPPRQYDEEEVAITANNSDNNSLEQDEDDNASVTSNEIKEILTNIQDVQELEDEPTIPTTEEVSDKEIIMSEETVTKRKAAKPSINASAKKTAQLPEEMKGMKLNEMTDAQINDISYDNLRIILRQHGVTNPRGSKTDLITKALEVKTSKKILQL